MRKSLTGMLVAEFSLTVQTPVIKDRRVPLTHRNEAMTLPSSAELWRHAGEEAAIKFLQK